MHITGCSLDVFSTITMRLYQYLLAIEEETSEEHEGNDDRRGEAKGHLKRRSDTRNEVTEADDDLSHLGLF